jgi:hypothetical protein
MKLWIAILAAAAGLTAAAEKNTRPAAKPAAAALTVPPGAQQIDPGTWRYQDQGKTWIYRQTPFGLSRFEEKPAESPASPATAEWISRQTPFGTARVENHPADTAESKALAEKAEKAADTQAFNDGDFVRFERNGPFGVYKWRRNKNELNESERRAWDRARSVPAGERK